MKWLGNGNKIQKWAYRHTVVVALIIFSAILPSLILINTSSIVIYNWYDNQFRWKNKEEAKINQIAPLHSTTYVDKILGSPVLTKSLEKNLTQSTYRLRAGWVQTIANDKDGEVQLLNVTTCSRDFNPEIKNVPFKPFRLGEVTMNNAVYAFGYQHREVSRQFTPESPTNMRYSISGATAQSYTLDEYSFGNPGRYQTFIIGYSDSCRGSNVKNDIGLTLPYIKDFQNLNVISEINTSQNSNKTLREYRNNQLVNSYTVTAPFVDPSSLGLDYEGIQYTDIRTLP